MSIQLINGDCLDVLDMLPDSSVDSIVTDPPYGLKFMGKSWDHSVPSVEVWRECLRVLKPGGHLLSFFGTRTYHRGVVNIEDAGFAIRDQIAWVYGSGFPKSTNVALNIDKAAGAVGHLSKSFNMKGGGDRSEEFAANGRDFSVRHTPASPEAARWQGWGTALKPAVEPIVVARKPLIGTVAENVLEWGVGGLNIDGCRVNPGEIVPGGGASKRGAQGGGIYGDGRAPANAQPHDAGRWPANLIHDGSDEVLACFPQAPGQIADASSSEIRKTQNVYGEMRRGRGDEPSADSANEGEVGFKMKPGARRLDSGSAARFFYCAKASKSDRNDGLDDFQPLPSAASEFRPNHTEKAEQGHDGNPYGRWKPLKNNHPTVKPTELMRYLCRLVTPPGGTVLDPFMGSGSTGRGAVLEGFDFIGIELDPNYHSIARARVNAALIEALA